MFVPFTAVCETANPCASDRAIDMIYIDFLFLTCETIDNGREKNQPPSQKDVTVSRRWKNREYSSQAMQVSHKLLKTRHNGHFRSKGCDRPTATMNCSVGSWTNKTPGGVGQVWWTRESRGKMAETKKDKKLEGDQS